MKDLDSLIKKHLPEVIALRHELHKIPEIAGKEKKTSALIREKLADLPALKLLPPFLKTDVVALMGDPRRPNLTLRADIDALPIEEKNDLPYKSTHAGMMHACGHDGHTAMLYGAILCLNELQEDLRCSLRFLFQPGEEIRAMAKPLIDAGAIENPKAEFVAGIHNWPKIPHGVFTTKTGAIMAAAGFFRIVLTGKGGHGSLPKLAKNPLIAAAEIVSGTQNIIPENCVLTICSVNGGNNSNVIPEQAVLEGTVRYLDSAAGEKMISDFRALCEKICTEKQILSDFQLDVPYPPTINSREGYEFGKNCIVKYFGEQGFREMPESSMGGEDFSFFLQKSNGIFCHLGTGENAPNLHSDIFDFDDSILEYGIRFFVGLALEFPE